MARQFSRAGAATEAWAKLLAALIAPLGAPSLVYYVYAGAGLPAVSGIAA